MKTPKKITICFILLAGQALSQVIDIRGIGDAMTVNESGVALPEGEAATQAIREAAINGIDRILEQQSSALRQQFNERARVNEEIGQLIRNIINDAKVTTNAIPEQKMTRATVEGAFDLQALRDILNRIPKINDDVIRSSENTAVFFTVRATKQIVSDAGIVEIASENIDSVETASEGTEEESIEVREKVEQNAKKKFIRSDSRGAEMAEMIADSQFKPLFGTGLLSQLSAKGFNDITDGSFFEISEEMDKDITERNDLRPATWRSLIDEIKKEGDGVEVVIIGSLDFAMPGIDPVSGLSIVEATMSGKVYRIIEGRRQPSLVAGLPPQSAKGTGPSQENAKQSALNAMSVLAANEIITALKNNSVVK
jgi:hypothetical protein